MHIAIAYILRGWSRYKIGDQGKEIDFDDSMKKSISIGG
jgi:hypothetical protein